MLRVPLQRLYERLGPRYPRVVLALVFLLSCFVVGGGVLLLNLYVDISLETFWRIFFVSAILVAHRGRGRPVARPTGSCARPIAGCAASARRTARWPRGRRSRGCRSTCCASGAASRWRSTRSRSRSTSPLELDGTFLSFLAIAAGRSWSWPMASSCASSSPSWPCARCWPTSPATCPTAPTSASARVPLRSKLLIALPVINVVTGVVVAGLASDDPSLRALGIGVVVALSVAFTLSFELSALLARSVVEPIQDLREGTERVTAGDLGVRVPVLGTDETGRLAESFNQMVAGLEERERLREAFGAFVDPQLAERVLEEGTVIEGEEVEVTVLFVDIREFTAFAERASASEVVTELNAFYELVVPVLVRHGGHANKFVGDGLLGVFGAPEHLVDHADRGVAAAIEIAEVVRRAYGGRLRIGIGVNSGPVVAGTIGGGGRVEFTVIGDTVNTAARVEAITRETDDTVLVTDATCALLQRDHGGFARAAHRDPARAQRAGHRPRGDGGGGRARGAPRATTSRRHRVADADDARARPRRTTRRRRRRACRAGCASARRIGRSPWPSSGSRMVTAQRSVGTATRRVAAPMATSRPAQPSSSHARAPSIEIVIRKRRGSTTASSRAAETAASEPSDISVTGWSSPPLTSSSRATSSTGRPR